MPDPSHQAKRLVDAAVVNGPFTYAGWQRYVLEGRGFDTTIGLVEAGAAGPELIGRTGHARRLADTYNRPEDTRSIDAWIAQNPRYDDHQPRPRHPPAGRQPPS